MGRIFVALASTSRRRKLLAYPNAGELTAGKTGERFDFSKSALLGGLRILEDAGPITRKERVQFIYFKQVPERLANTIFAWAAELCPVAAPLKPESRSKARKRSNPLPYTSTPTWGPIRPP